MVLLTLQKMLQMIRVLKTERPLRLYALSLPTSYGSESPFPVRNNASAGLVPNGVDLRRAGDVNPLILRLKCEVSGHLRTPLAGETP